MVAAGVRMIESIERLDIIGIPTISELNRAISVYRKLSRYIRSNRFDVVVFIDNPGLNLRLARVAKESGHRTIYYIAPQIWAWNEARIQKLQKYVDKLLVILPFEEDYFRKAGIDCKFVGHPIIENLKTQYDSAALRQEFEIRENVKVIGLLPGSRWRPRPRRAARSAPRRARGPPPRTRPAVNATRRGRRLANRRR